MPALSNQISKADVSVANAFGESNFSFETTPASVVALYYNTLKSNCHLPVLWPLLTVYQDVCDNKKIKHEWPCCFGSHKWLKHDDFMNLCVLETLLVFSVILQS